MTQRTFLLLALFFLCLAKVQANTDSSRVEDLLKIVNENRQDSTLALTNLYKAYDIAKSSKNHSLLGRVFIVKGVLHYTHSEFDSCEIYWKQASRLFSLANDSINWGQAERLVGVSFDLQGVLDSSLSHLLIALDIHKKTGNKKGIGEVYISLGIIQQKMERFDAAIETNGLALQLAFEEGNEGVIGPIYNNIGSLYQNMGEVDSGFKYLLLALSMQDKINNPSGKAKILHNIGTIELVRKKYKSAKDYYFTSIALTGGPADPESLQGTISIGNCYLKLGQLDSAKSILMIAIQVTDIKQGARDYKSIYDYLSQIEEKEGNYEKALKYHKLYSSFQDTIYQETMKTSIHELEAAMELEFEKDKNESLLLSSAEIQELLHKNRQGVNLLILLSSALLILIIILIRNLNRLRSGRADLAQLNESLVKNADELEANNKKLENIMTNKNDLVSVMAHDLRSPFGKIQSIVQLFELSYDEEERKSYLQMLDNITRDGMALIQDLIDLSRIEGNVLADEHIERLNTFTVSGIFSHLNSSFASHLKAKQLVLELNLSDEPILNREDYCERICDNLISNAIKYSNPGGVIKVNSVIEGDMIKIGIEDNGPGFKESDMNRLFQRFSRLSARPTGIETSTGLGLYIAKKLAESIHGDIILLSKPNEPAKFCVEIPVNLKNKLNAQSAT